MVHSEFIELHRATSLDASLLRMLRSVCLISHSLRESLASSDVARCHSMNSERTIRCKPNAIPVCSSFRLHSESSQWRNRQGGTGGQSAPRDFWPGNFCWCIGKTDERKKGKGVKIEKKRRKIVKGKVENWKSCKKRWGPFFFFFFFFFAFHF